MQKNDRGAILIQTAITLGVMMALSAFVVDMGVLWMARRQAQNAADAAALAAGTSLMYDSYIDRTSTGPAHAAGVATAQLNKVFGQAPQVQVDQSVDPTGWSPAPPPDCLPALARGTCAQASVFRDATHGNAVPTYIAGFLSSPTQNSRATATVQLRGGSANNCVKPWIAADKSDTTSYNFTDYGTLLILRTDAGPSAYQQADFNGSGANCPVIIPFTKLSFLGRAPVVGCRSGAPNPHCAPRASCLRDMRIGWHCDARNGRARLAGRIAVVLSSL